MSQRTTRYDGSLGGLVSRFIIYTEGNENRRIAQKRYEREWVDAWWQEDKKRDRTKKRVEGKPCKTL